MNAKKFSVPSNFSLIKSGAEGYHPLREDMEVPMEMQDESLLNEHLPNDPELKNLWNEHQKYEQQLRKLATKPFLNSEEKIEKKRLQVAKLAGKTRMEAILRKYR